jgi:hypothetical protein
MNKWIISSLFTALLMFCSSVSATVYYVDDVPTNGSGTQSSPFNNLSSALNTAQPGDMVYVLSGTYNESFSTERDGVANQRITIQAHDPGNRPIVTFSGQVLVIDHSYITIDGFILDGQFGSADVVKIKDGGDNAEVRNCEIKNGVKDGIDLNEADNVLIENCEIHHFLGGTISNQVDAHGIVATGEKNLTIRGCNIYYTSGDCFQTDPNRGYPLWDNVLIENCKLWTGPLPAGAAGWNAGEIPGENGIDTKINEDAVNTSYRPKIILKQVEAYGFVEGYINNRAAFNIKEKVDCELIAVKVYNNEIGFRLRGPGSRGGAYVTIINTIAYDNEKTFRIEDGVEYLHIYNSTFDKGNGNEYIQAVSGGYDPNGFDLRNCLFVGTKPPDASDPSNLSANSSFFMNMANHNYRLSSASPAIDAGDDIVEVTDDYNGNPRYSGSYDVGAFEYNSSSGIDDPGETGLKDFYLHPNYPNPFNPTTYIVFDTGQLAAVHLEIFDIVGNRIRTLVDDMLPAGQHHLQWDGRDAGGRFVVSGIYFYRLKVDHSSQTRKMHFLR